MLSPLEKENHLKEFAEFVEANQPFPPTPEQCATFWLTLLEKALEAERGRILLIVNDWKEPTFAHERPQALQDHLVRIGKALNPTNNE